jgi:hypothetical protein
MAETDLAVFAHLFRRAGFGATRAELETTPPRLRGRRRDLIHPERSPAIDEDLSSA